MQQYTTGNPSFSESISIPEITDTNSADNINASTKQLLENTLVNRQNIEAMCADSYPDDVFGIDISVKDPDDISIKRISNIKDIQPGIQFDKYPMFNRRRCNLTDMGEVVAYYGEPGYTETGALTQEITKKGATYPVGTLVQVMVEQPKFYYKTVPYELRPAYDGNKGFRAYGIKYYISPCPYEGFKLHPAFATNSGQIDCERIYLAAYEGSLWSYGERKYLLDDSQDADLYKSTLSSVAGAKPASGEMQELTRAAARRMAYNRSNTGAWTWQQSSIQTVSLTQLLFMVEYAQLSMKAIGSGNVNQSESDSAKNYAEPTGATSSLGNASGAVTKENGATCISYRGEENFFGNIWTYIDGLNLKTDQKNLFNELYTADYKFEDGSFHNSYRKTGCAMAEDFGFIHTFCYSPSFDWSFIPSGLHYGSPGPGDSVWDGFHFGSPDTTVFELGGCWNSGFRAGSLSIRNNHDSEYHSAQTGARLVYIPSNTF